jgi:tetratricopeptide (TPR) repeat protein
LAKAESLSPDAETRFRIALKYQELKGYEAALRILDGLVSQFPANGDFIGARGLCRFLSGSKKDSAADLEAAIRLNPESLSAYLTLGAIYSAGSSDDLAAAVYDRALAVPGTQDDSKDLRRLILQSRRSALSRMGPRRAVSVPEPTTRSGQDDGGSARIKR